MLNNGLTDVTARGICWGLLPDPDISGAHTAEGQGLGAFSSNLNNLEAGTTYYYRAYATNAIGTAYGAQMTFSTLAYTVPEVTTTAVTDITDVSAVSGGTLLSDGGLPILEEVMPNATVTGFTDTAEAIDYAKSNRVALAFLDIELRNTSGLDLCRELLKINPRTNVVYLTAYSEYALDAWSTGASGFMLKPITPDDVREQLQNLRYPFWTGGEGE